MHVQKEINPLRPLLELSFFFDWEFRSCKWLLLRIAIENWSVSLFTAKEAQKKKLPSYIDSRIAVE